MYIVAAVKWPWLALCGPILAMVKQVGLENATLTFISSKKSGLGSGWQFAGRAWLQVCSLWLQKHLGSVLESGLYQKWKACRR